MCLMVFDHSDCWTEINSFFFLLFLFRLLAGDKPHACELCNKRFALACNLRAHMKTHEGKSRHPPLPHHLPTRRFIKRTASLTRLENLHRRHGDRHRPAQPIKNPVKPSNVASRFTASRVTHSRRSSFTRF